jgi:hypothetical protein
MVSFECKIPANSNLGWQIGSRGIAEKVERRRRATEELQQVAACFDATEEDQRAII